LKISDAADHSPDPLAREARSARLPASDRSAIAIEAEAVDAIRDATAAYEGPAVGQAT